MTCHNPPMDFIIYGEWWPAISLLGNEQKGALLHALFASCAGCCEAPSLDEQTRLVFLLIEPRIMAAQEKYAARKKANRENGKKGGRPPKPEPNGFDDKNPITDGFLGFDDGNPNIRIRSSNSSNPPLTPPSGGDESLSLFSLSEHPGASHSKGTENTTDTGSQSRTDKRASKAKRQPKNADLPPYTVKFEACWKAYPNPSGKKTAWGVFLDFSRKGILPEDILERIQNRALEQDWLENARDPARRRFIPHMSTWLNAYGWEDDGCLPEEEKRNSPEDERRNEIMAKYNFGMPVPGENPADVDAKNRRMEIELTAAGL